MSSGAAVSELVLLGAGPAHLAVLRRFAGRPLTGGRVTLVAAEPDIPDLRTLPGLIRGDLTVAQACIDLGRLCAAARARLVLAEAVALDLAGQGIDLPGRPPLPFGVLSIDLPGGPAVPPRDAPLENASAGAAPPRGASPRATPLRDASAGDGPLRNASPRAAPLRGAVAGTAPLRGASAGDGPLRGASPRAAPLGDASPGAAPFGDASPRDAPAGAAPLGDAPARDAPPGDALAGDALAIALHPLPSFMPRLAALEAALPAGARVAIAGTDPVAPELALALAWRWRGRLRPVLVSPAPEPLAAAPTLARRAVRSALVEAGIELASAVQAGPLANGRLALSDGSFLQADAMLLAGPPGAAAFLAAAGLACDAAGRILVRPTRQSISHPAVFAAGASAAPVERAAPPGLLSANLRRAVNAARPLPPLLPQPTAPVLPAMLELAPGRAVAWGNGVAAVGQAVSRVKSWRDRRHLRLHAPAAQRSQAAVRIGPIAAAGARTVMPHRMAPDALVGFELPDHTAVLNPPVGKTLVQTVASLPASGLDDLFLFGQVAAAHALSEQYAVGAQPWTALVLAALPHDAGAARAQADLRDMLAGAESVLAANGCAVAGGHTAAAAQPTLGFAVSGLADPARLPRRRRLRAGDVLVLTKPLGAGIVLTGHAAARARAAWLRAATDAMRDSDAAAAQVLQAHGMTACAAVNGAGLGGHLRGLLGAAGLGAVLWPDAVPVLPGAMELLAAPAPRRVVGPAPPAVDPFPALLADPQVSGGLVAGVPQAEAAACLAALHGAGVAAAIIGLVEPADAGAPMIRIARG